MDQLLAAYDKKIVMPAGKVNGAIAVDDFEDYSTSESEDDEGQYDQYEHEYVYQELRKYGKCAVEAQDESGMSSVEGVAGIEYKNNPLSVYQNYRFNATLTRKELPIDSFKQKILDLIKVNSVLVIQGPTGCGKTTQVPQYILDDCREKQEFCNIAVTQPRKIATINVAKRVCEERGWTLGTVCGYQVGLEKKISNDVLITYMTTGVLLQKLIKNKTLHQYTHIIIDEVHERNQDLDFLLVIVRRFLFTNSPKTKVILMSATIEAQEFAYYFRSQGPSISMPAPIIQVSKQGSYKKHYFYLEHLKPIHDLTETTFHLDKPEISEGIWNMFASLVNVMDRLDNKDTVTGKQIVGSVLVFLPGINEIEEAHSRLIRYAAEKKSRDGSASEGGHIEWTIIPLHSSLPNDDQALVFQPAKPNHRKVILSTNIAESSITVPDSYYVIDFCLTKVMTVDPVTKYMSLKLEWASHTNCEQRAGRVGRIGDGRVYRLVSSEFYKKMPEKSIPEMLRAPLERVVLQSKMLNLNDTPRQILALALNPPNLKNIEMTIFGLKEIGGLLQTCRGTYTASDGDITFLGTVMANLPLDVRLSKLILLGYLFSCLDEAIIMAAGCSIQNIFSIPFQQRLNAYKKLLEWADGSYSDLIALLNVYRVWRACKRDNQFENIHAEYRWCQRHLISLKGLREWSLLVTEITQRLEHMNIQKIPGQVQLIHDEKPLILKLIAAGAFYPNYFIRDPDAAQLNERDTVKIVGGRNPLKTIYFMGMDPRQPGPLYIRAIKDMLADNHKTKANMEVGFDGSTKIYVEFKNTDKREQITVSVDGQQMITDSIPTKIPKEIYEAIRKRQLGTEFAIKILPEDEAWRWVKENGIKINSTFQTLDASSSSDTDRDSISSYPEEEYSPVPPLDVEHVTIKISEFVDASHFWVNSFESENYLAQIDQALNKTVLRNVLEVRENVSVGKRYAARYADDNLFYRCQVLSLTKKTAQVMFIDYGNIQVVRTDELYILPNNSICKVAPLALECVLHGVQPSRKMNPKGVWSENLNMYWKRQLVGILLYGKVHSVVDNVANLIIYKKQRESLSVNEVMLQMGHAEPAAESFLSKADHEKRQMVMGSANPTGEAARYRFDKVVNYSDFETPQMHGSHYRRIPLKGPYNPLEMKLFGCLQSSGNKMVEVEGQSVNTVLLDSDPEDNHTRLLVASSVNQTTKGDRLRLRQTTLMPNIPGLPMLLMLIFCPTMEVKVTEDGTRVASILCGLGFNKYTKKALYPAHDLVLMLDTELTEEEITKVNGIRFYMNQGVNLMQEISNRMSSQEEMITTQQALKKSILDLIYTDRQVIPRTGVKHANIWGLTDENLIMLKPNMPDQMEDIWPLHWFVKLKRSDRFNMDVSRNLDDMDQMARNMIPMKQIECCLCMVPCFTVHEVRLHLSSDQHKQKKSEYMASLEYEEDE
ncbi:unnamed protein product [Callosobruchus maculatus]|nr:unnamed protein product [Callosobruchus maculatus]